MTITAVNNADAELDKSITVSGSVSNAEVAAPDDVTLTITDDDRPSTPTLYIDAPSVTEGGPGDANTLEWTVTLLPASTQRVSVSVAVNSTGTATVGTLRTRDQTGADHGFPPDPTLVFAAGVTKQTTAVSVYGDATPEPDETVVMELSNPSNASLAASTGTGKILDDDAPTVTLAVADNAIAENGGTTTVTATLNRAYSNAATTVTVTAVAGAYTVGADATITIAAGETSNAADNVTITAVDDAIDNVGDRSVTVTGTASTSGGAGRVTGAVLTLTDDEATPTATLVLSPATIDEHDGTNPGSATVTATLNRASSEAVTLTVEATAGTNAAATDFSLSSAKTLTIAAGLTSSTGTVTVTAIDNTTAAPDKEVTVSAVVSGSSGVATPDAVTLTIEDDEAAPTVSLAVADTAIAENGGTTTVTAKLSHASSAATTITVTAVNGSYTVGADATIEIAAGDTSNATDTATITAVNDAIDNVVNRTTTVSGTAQNIQGVGTVTGARLTLTDDEATPTATLVLTPPRIDENGGAISTTVTATLNHASSEALELTVSATADTNAVDGDFALSASKTLTISAGSLTSSGVVTISAVNNDEDEPDKSVRVSATASGASGVANPSNVTLTISDDDDTPTASLVLSSSSISENGGVATVTATLSGESSEATTITVSAAGSDYTLSADKTLTIAAGSTTSSGVVTISAVNNDKDEPDKSVTVSGLASGGRGVANPSNVTLTITDDDDTPTASLVLSSSSISENGGIATVTATLSGASSEALTITVSATGSGYTLSTDKTLTIAAGETTSSGTVTISAVNNDKDEPDKSVTVSGLASGGRGVANPSNVTLTITDDDDTPTVSLSLSSSSISENGGIATVTATLSGESSEALTLTVSAAGSGYTLSTDKTLTIAAGSTTSSGTVTISAVNNDKDEPDKSVTVSGLANGGRGVANPSNVTLTITDDDDTPTASLILSSSSISENGGIATVTATLSGESSEALTITVSATGSGYTLSADKTLTIAAGETTSSGVVTISAVNNDKDEPDKSVTVSGLASGGRGVANPSNVTLTIQDDDDTPTVSLSLSSSSISENGGIATVTATLSGESSEALTLTISATGSGYTLSTDKTLTIAAGSTTSSGVVTISAVNNDKDEPDKSVTVSGLASGGRGVANPSNETLTISDDEDLPTVSLSLSSSSISENGGIATVTATLSGASSEALTLTVSAAGSGYTLSADKTLTIAAGSTTSSGTVTITAVNNDKDEPDKSVTVSGLANGGRGVANPSNVTLTISDDERTPTVSLSLSSSSISENGGIATVTATLSGTSSEALTLTVSATGSGYTLSADKTLTIAAGETTSSGTVTISAVNNDKDEPDKNVTVSGLASGGRGVANPSNVTLTITDDDDTPTASLVLSSSSISENGGIATVTATLSGASSEALTLTVSAAGSGYTLSADKTLTIAAGSTASSGTVTISAVNNDKDEPDKSVTVSGLASGGRGVANPSNETLTISDDEDLPTVSLSLSSSSISENGGIATVTATLSGASSEALTLTVSAAGSGYTLSTDKTLTIAAGETTSSGTVTISAVNNDKDEPDKSVTVSGLASGGRGVANPSNVTLTIQDDERTPTVSLSLSSSSISENGGVATVTATLSGASSEAVTLTVATTVGTNAASGDFTLSSAKTLTIAAGETTSSGTVTITAIDNDVDAPDKSVTVSGTTSNTGVTAPQDVTLTIRDDEAAPTATLALADAAISENGGTTTVMAKLSHASSATTTITVQPVAGAYTVGADATITIAAGDTSNATDTATITAVDDAIDNVVNRTTTVSGTAQNSQGVGTVTGASLTLTDDEGVPTATLVLSPATIDEHDGTNPGSATVTATLSGASTEAVTLTVAATAGTNAAATDFSLSSAKTLTIAAGVTSSTGTVTVTAVDNTVDAPNKQVTVSAVVSGNSGVATPTAVTLTIEDDEAAPTVALAVGDTSISENGGTTTVTATLSHASVAATTITVSAAAGAHTVAADFNQTGTTLSIAAGATTSTGTVTIAAVDDANDAAHDKKVTVTGMARNSHGVGTVTGASVTLKDDDVNKLPSFETVIEDQKWPTETEIGRLNLPQAIGGDGTLTYTMSPALPLWLTRNGFAVTGTTPATPVPGADYTWTVRDSDGDEASLTFEIAVAITTAESEGGLPSLAISSPRVTEGAAGATAALNYKVTLSATSTEQVTVKYADAGTGTAVSGTDYAVLSSGTLTFAPGDTSKTVTVTVIGDGVDEPNETVKVSLSLPVNANVPVSGSTGTGTIEDDEVAPRVTLAVAAAAISENGGTTTVMAKLSHASSATTTITVQPVAGAYTVGADATITIAAGDTSNVADTATITAVDDAIANVGNRAVTVTGVAQNSQGVGTVTGARLTLTDDEGVPTATLVLSPATIDEHDGTNPGSATVTATLSGASSEAVTLTVAATAGTNAAATDFSLSSAKTLTIAAGETTSSGTVTISAVNNDKDEPDKSVTVSATVSGGSGVANPTDATLTIQDDDDLPTVSLSLSSSSISENGGIATVTATLSGASSEALTLTVSAAGSGYTLSTDKTLTIAAGSTTSSGTVTISAVNNDKDEPDRNVTVSGLASGGRGVANPSDVTLTISDDDNAPSFSTTVDDQAWTQYQQIAAFTLPTATGGDGTATHTLSPALPGGVSKDGNHQVSGTPSVALSETTYTWAATETDGDKAELTFTISVDGVPSFGSQTIDDQAWTRGTAISAFTLPAATGGDGSVSYTLSPALPDGVSRDATTREISGTPTATKTLTTYTWTATDADGDAASLTFEITVSEKSIVTLVLTPSAIDELTSGGTPSPGSATVTATLDKVSSSAVTITVSASPVRPAVPGDFTLSSAKTLTIAAGETTSSGTVTITAIDNDVDAPDKSVTVSGTTSNTGVTAPQDETLTIRDDEAEPTVALALADAAISENGGTTTVTAKLSHASSATTTITVQPVAGAYTVGADATIEIAAGDTSNATDTATITAVDDAIANVGNRAVTVSGTAQNSQGVGTVTGAALTLTDDEGVPTATLVLSSATIDEHDGTNPGSATVTATLSGASTEAVTLTVAATAGTNAASGDFSLSSAKTLTIAAGVTSSTGTVTVTAVDNTTDAPDKQVTVSAVVSGSSGVAAPEAVTLTIEDDEVAPTVSLVLAAAAISENGGTTTVMAKLSHASSATTTITVQPEAGAYTVGADATIEIAAGDTSNVADTATITAVDDAIANVGNRAVTVTGSAQNSQGVGTVTGAALTLTDDEGTPTATLVLSSSSISENGGVATVTATLSGASTEAVTLTIAAAAGTNAASGDFSLSSAKTLTIAAGETTSSGTVTVMAVDNTVDAPDKQVTVSAVVSGNSGVAVPEAVTLTIEDDEAAPTVSLAVADAAISENGGTTTVMAKLSHASSATTTITVQPEAGAYTVGADATITIAAGDTSNATDTATITAVDDAIANVGNRAVTVSGSAQNSQGVGTVTGAALTLTDDEGTPTATLVLNPATIDEHDGTNPGSATVTATLSGASTEAVTLTIAAAAGTNAASGDFSLSSAKTLTIAAGVTSSTGTVTVTAVDNTVDAPDKQVTVSAVVSGNSGVAVPEAVTLTIEDDEAAPTVALAVTDAAISENGGTTTVMAKLSHASSATTTITVQPEAGAYTVGADATIEIAAGDTSNATDTATITAVDDVIANVVNRTTTVSGTAQNSQGVGTVTGASLTLTDDEGVPTASLVLSSSSISENGGVATVTATLSGASTEAVTLTMAATAGTNAASGDFSLSSAKTLTIAAGVTSSTGTVTVTAVDNTVDAPDKQVTVSAGVSGNSGVVAPEAVTLTIEDDEAEPTVSLVLADAAISENGGTTTVMAKLSHASSATTTITVQPEAGAYTVGADATIEIAAGDTSNATDTATITAVDDAIANVGNRAVTVSGTAQNSQGVGTVTGASLTLTDDEGVPTASLVLSPTAISENGGVATVTATVSGASTEAVTLTVSAAGSGYTLSTDKTLTIAAGSTSSTGTVTVTAVDNTVDAPDKEVTVSAVVSGSSGVAAPTAVTLTIEDDEAAPTVSLVLADAAISENGGTTTVMAKLSHASSAATTITVQPVAGAYTVGADATITIAAGDTSNATDTATITAVDDAIANVGNRAVTVSGSAQNSQGVGTVTGASLTLTDDEGVPTASLVLSPSSISENGGVATVTAKLSHASGAAVTITVSAAGSDYTLSTDKMLTIAAGSTASSGTVTISAVNNDKDEPDKSVTVSGTASGGNGVANPSNVTLTITDDDNAPSFSTTVDDQAWTQYQPIAAFTLPTATGGDGTVTYTLSPALPGGVSKAANHQVSGTPSVALSETTYTWTATDADNDTATLEFTITVENAPIADPLLSIVLSFGSETIADQAWIRNEAITAFTLPSATGGQGSLSYSIDPALPDGVTKDASHRVSGTPNAAQSQTTYTWTATDANSATATLTFTITVSSTSPGQTDLTPIFNPNTYAAQRYTYRKTITPVTLPAASGGDVPLTYALSPILPNGLSFSETTRVISGTPTETKSETTYTLTATDGDGDTADLTFSVTVILAVPDPPANLRATAGNEQATLTWENPNNPTITRYEVRHAPENEDILAVAWTTITGSDARTTEHTLTGLTNGMEYTFHLRAVNAAGAGPKSEQTLAMLQNAVFAQQAPPNSVPTFTDAVDFQRYRQGTAIALIFPEAIEGDGTLTYALTPPAGLTYTPPAEGDDHGGIMAGTPPDPQAKTIYTLTATDEDGDEATLSFFVVVMEDLLPSFTDAVGTQRYVQNRAIEKLALPEATGGDGVLTYELTPVLPAGLERDERTISGTPTEAMTMTEYRWVATDEDGDTAALAFAISVAADLMPVFTDTASAQNYEQHVEIDAVTLPAATGGDGELSYVLMPLLPDGLRFNPATRVLSGTPSETMDATLYTLLAVDADGDMAKLMFTIEVTVDLVPAFTETVGSQRFVENQAITPVRLPQATGGDGVLTYTLTPDPSAGLTFDETTRRFRGCRPRRWMRRNVSIRRQMKMGIRRHWCSWWRYCRIWCLRSRIRSVPSGSLRIKRLHRFGCPRRRVAMVC